MNKKCKKKKLNMYAFGGSWVNPKNPEDPASVLKAANQSNMISGGIGLAGNMVGSMLIDPNKNNSQGAQIGSGVLKGAASGASFGPYGAIIGGAIGGVKGFFDNKTEDKLYEEKKNMEAFQNIQNRNAQFGISNNINLSALGGQLKNKKNINVVSTFKPDINLTQFNVGGLHEENPNGGIPQGINKENGKPNTVEQGETKFQDYVFSNRLILDNPKDFGLNVPKGISFAKASKYLFKDYEERPQDAISKRTYLGNMEKLKAANDYFRSKEESTQFKEGGKLFKDY